jgi:hypothetical protein
MGSSESVGSTDPRPSRRERLSSVALVGWLLVPQLAVFVLLGYLIYSLVAG